MIDVAIEAVEENEERGCMGEWAIRVDFEGEQDMEVNWGEGEQAIEVDSGEGEWAVELNSGEGGWAIEADSVEAK